MGIDSEEQVRTYHAKGALFENLIINELIKANPHHGRNPRFYFWQNKTKQGIDLVIDHPEGPVPYEIKSGMTMNESYFTNLKYWQKLTGDVSGDLNVIYGGDANLNAKPRNFISWRSLKDIEK